jgi:murein DD-endopeptidase MepM/ murein hydrolase activator NlpD
VIVVLRSRYTFLALGVIFCASCSATSGTASKPKQQPVTPIVIAKAPPPAPPQEAPRTDFWLDRDPVQGGLIKARAPSDAISVTLNGAPLPLTKDGFFLIGFDRDAENSASLVAKRKNGQSLERYLPVRPGDWKIERVNTNPTGGAATTAEFNARRGSELAQINAARRSNADVNGWRQDFIWPVKGRLSGYFGSQRIYRGSPGSYHSGMDIAGAVVGGKKTSLHGVVFVAPADGIVTLAAQDEFTLEGHLLMLDHGMGLNSAFLHCSELLVKEGDFVRQGQPIGKVGMSGRASGPHLHWGMKWNAARVDPKLLLGL